MNNWTTLLNVDYAGQLTVHVYDYFVCVYLAVHVTADGNNILKSIHFFIPKTGKID